MKIKDFLGLVLCVLSSAFTCALVANLVADVAPSIPHSLGVLVILPTSVAFGWVLTYYVIARPVLQLE